MALYGANSRGLNKGNHGTMLDSEIGFVLLYWIYIVMYCYFFAALCAVQAACSESSEFLPALCPVKLPRIVKISITENGIKAKQDGADTTDCKNFKLNASQVRRYFGKAMQVKDELDARAKLDWSPCSATGSMVFADGRTANWQIGQTQVGTLMWDGGETVQLYCPGCRFRPFRW